MIFNINDDDGMDFGLLVDETGLLIERCVIEIRFHVNVALSRRRETRGRCAGLFNSYKNFIYIDRDYWERRSRKQDYKDVVHTLCHEVGHAVHFNYLAEKPQYLQRKYGGDPRYHCNKNADESFAECFADYCIAVFENNTEIIENSKRLSQMKTILANIEKGGYELKTVGIIGGYDIKDSGFAKLSNMNARTRIDDGCNDHPPVYHPYADKIRENFRERLLNCRIDELYLSYGIADYFTEAGYQYVRDLAKPEITAEFKIKRIPQFAQEEILKVIRKCGVEVV